MKRIWPRRRVALAGLAATLMASSVASGCASVQRVLRIGEPAAPPPAESPTAPFAGMDRLLQPPGGSAGSFDRVAYPAGAAVATVAPGDSLVLLDMAGPAVVRRLRISMRSDDPHWLRRVAIRMYWEDEARPSVHVPIGDFFGNAFERRPYAALPMGVTAEGFYSHLPMPFGRRARIVLENGSDLPLEGVRLDADVETAAPLAEPIATLHALWTRDPRPRADRLHAALDVRGAGWFVGTVLNAQGHDASFAFLRGNGRIRVDGRMLDSSAVAAYLGAPSSTTDGGVGAVAGPLQGVVLQDPARSRLAAYRWHVTDPIPFREGIALELERGRANRDGAEYATVAYWYQSEPHGELPPLPGPHARRVPEVAIPPGAVRGGELEVVGMGGGTVRLVIPVPRPDLYEVVVYGEARPGAVNPRVTVRGGIGGGRTLDVSPPGAELGDILPGVVIDTVSTSARSLELELSAREGGIGLPAAVHLRPVLGWADRWWRIGSWPAPGATDPADALRNIWEPDRDPSIDRRHELPGGRETRWMPVDAERDGHVELVPAGGTGYAQAFLYAPRARSVVLVIDGDGAQQVLVGDTPAIEQVSRFGVTDHELEAWVQPGWNRVLVKLAALGPAGFRLRAADPAGELAWSRTAP